ncbi:hypothetical protein [Pseudodesulfovibrio sp.]|uniref:DUF7946 domain-containing protein n=1 Tax=Pseudodesulfovibrio sp. TaxID=2035812 RepID=UPI00262DB138|nr:hypothetical protein [Pseudodesulfovibrio sp.]MDD3312004.1 hypothetical protein [Pseudodesulfovibrio sp.]
MYMGPDSDSSKILDISIKYCEGMHAINSSIDLYDLSVALNGLHRSLALTTHYFCHREIITKAPFVRGINILSKPPTIGSFEVTASVWLTTGIIASLPAIYKVLTAPKDTVLGHIVWSLYDMVIHKTTGQFVDFDKSIYAQYIDKEEYETKRIESLAQKLESSVKNIHRPIMTRSALSSTLSTAGEPSIVFNSQTLDLTNRLTIESEAQMLIGRVAGYSANTKSGMIYSQKENRAIPFELEKGCDVNTKTLTRSLFLYDAVKGNRGSRAGFFKFNAKKVVNQAGTTKKYYITYAYGDSMEK